MQKTFRTLTLAVNFYRVAQAQQLPGYMKNQLLRASSSIALNLSEGNAKFDIKDRRRFFRIAYASLKECQTIAELHNLKTLRSESDSLGAHLFKMCKALDAAAG